jgi:hypothetical protein
MGCVGLCLRLIRPAQVLTLMERLDRNCDGIITVTELHRGLVDMGMPLPLLLSSHSPPPHSLAPFSVRVRIARTQ